MVFNIISDFNVEETIERQREKERGGGRDEKGEREIEKIILYIFINL